MNLLRMLFDFRGRINRAKFWLTALIWFVLFVLIIAAAAARGSMGSGSWLEVASYAVMMVSGIAVGIKRMHDRDKSAWWLLLFYGIPFPLSLVTAAVGPHDMSIVSIVLQAVGVGVSLWALVELGMIRGTIGANRFGPDPLAPKPAHH